MAGGAPTGWSRIRLKDATASRGIPNRSTGMWEVGEQIVIAGYRGLNWIDVETGQVKRESVDARAQCALEASVGSTENHLIAIGGRCLFAEDGVEQQFYGSFQFKPPDEEG